MDALPAAPALLIDRRQLLDQLLGASLERGTRLRGSWMSPDGFWDLHPGRLSRVMTPEDAEGWEEDPCRAFLVLSV